VFRRIPGNLDYLIDENLRFITPDRKLVELAQDKHGNVEIEIFGKKRKISIRFLQLLTRYEIHRMYKLEDHWDKLIFYPMTHKIFRLTSSYILSFTEPIYYKSGFRYIPNYPRYAININGEVIDTWSNLKVNNKLLKDGYVIVIIYDHIKQSFKSVKLHRLLALAWLPNTDFINKPFINHIDGDKSNNYLENLEWCSHQHNVRHALDTGLTQTYIPMKTRDFLTGDVVIYKSAVELSNKLGMTTVRATHYINTLPGYLYKKRYEIKLLEDNSPWYYENIDPSEQPRKAVYTITVLNKKTGEIQKFNNLRVFQKAFKVPSNSTNVELIVTNFIDLYKDTYEISYKRNALKGPYQVLNLETKQISVFNSISEICGYIGRNRNEIRYDLVSKSKFIYNKKWVVTSGVQEIVVEDYQDKPKSFSNVLIIDVVNNIETVANSMKHASRVSGTDFKSIVKYINTGKPFKGKIFRAIE
jgi:hypothetical protein